MALAIRMRFLMGFYQGHDFAGEPERYPTVLRLYSALVDAAFSTLNDKIDRELTETALRWLESNPPEAIEFPESLPSWHRAPKTFRDKGLVKRNVKLGKFETMKKESARASEISALSGPISYYWKTEPSTSIIATLMETAAEIPYLGERPSVVSVSIAGDHSIPQSAHVLLDDSILFPQDATILEYPTRGRLEEMKEAHRASRPKQLPADAPKSNEVEHVQNVPRDRIALARYISPEIIRKQAPWNDGFAVSARYELPGVSSDRQAWNPDPAERLGWCVAFHRALVKQIGFGAPPMVTGVFPEGSEQPANHLAIQIVPPNSAWEGHELDQGASFVLLLPPETTSDERTTIATALNQMRRVYAGKQGALILGVKSTISPINFWQEPRKGWIRLWKPFPSVIFEIRGGQVGPGGEYWKLSDAIALAIGFVWRADFEKSKLRGLARYQQIVKTVYKSGVVIENPQRHHIRDIARFIHRTKLNGVTAAVTGLVDLGTLATSTQLVAIGQSRHLGGGMLVPIDFPEGLAEMVSNMEGEKNGNS